jgi:hypothetical protein
MVFTGCSRSCNFREEDEFWEKRERPEERGRRWTGARTQDQWLKRPLLYQLSYPPLR